MKLIVNGDKELLAKFGVLSDIDWRVLKAKQGADLRNRSNKLTPKITGELRLSAKFDGVDTFGFSKEYAPHVEYGHRTRGGGFVSGRFYLRENVAMQEPIYLKDVTELIASKIK